MDPDFTKYIKKHFKLPGTALDLGCGDGTDVEGLIHLGWQCDGVDIKTGTDLNHPYISPNSPYDLVYSNYVIQKLQNPSSLVTTIVKNLKHGGKFFVQTFYTTDNIARKKFSKQELSDLFNVGQLKIDQIKVFEVYDNAPGHQHFHQIIQISGIKTATHTLPPPPPPKH